MFYIYIYIGLSRQVHEIQNKDLRKLNNVLWENRI